MVPLQKMWDQEKDHLKKFNELMVAFRVRPTILMPLWNVAGFALGKCLLVTSWLLYSYDMHRGH